MKVCIVTVYNSINSGSYWQAYSLGQMIKIMGHQVYYYRSPSKGSPASTISQKIIYVKTFIKCGIKDANRYRMSVYEFKKSQKEHFDVIDEKDEVFENIDCFVIGSDTVWNIEDCYFSRWAGVFGGAIFNNKTKYSYAASMGNSTLALADGVFKESIGSFNRIAVRDNHTKLEIREIIGYEPKLVCDPTLLFNKEAELYDIESDLNIVQPYIFIYLFMPLSRIQEEAVVRFARERNYLLVSSLRKEYAPYSDIIFVNTPENFCRLMKNADYIVTDTYHGTLFPLIFRKQFIVIDRRKITVNSIMEYLDIVEWLVEDSSIEKMITTKIDYKIIEPKIRTFQNESISYLAHILKE